MKLTEHTCGRYVEGRNSWNIIKLTMLYFLGVKPKERATSSTKGATSSKSSVLKSSARKTSQQCLLSYSNDQKKKTFKSRLQIKLSIKNCKSNKLKCESTDEAAHPSPKSKNSTPQSLSLKRVRISSGKSWRSSLEELREAKTKFCSGINQAIGAIGKKTVRLASKSTSSNPKGSGKASSGEKCAPVDILSKEDKDVSADGNCDKTFESSSCRSDKDLKSTNDSLAHSADYNLPPISCLDCNVSHIKIFCDHSSAVLDEAAKGSSKRQVKVRASRSNVISDCTLYGTDHLQAVLKVSF